MHTYISKHYYKKNTTYTYLYICNICIKIHINFTITIRLLIHFGINKTFGKISEILKQARVNLVGS